MCGDVCTRWYGALGLVRGGAVRGRLRVWRLCAVASITFYIPYT
jgi:hypothetical protein